MINKIKKIGFSGLARVFFYLFFVFLPFRIDALVFTSKIYESGFFNPYTSFFIYLSDVCLIFSLLFLALAYVFKDKKINLQKIRDKFKSKLLIFAFVFLVLNICSLIFSVSPLNSIFYNIRILEFFIVFLLLAKNFVNIKRLLYIFIGIMSFQALIGILQFFMQKSVGLSFLGESVISNELLGVAKINLGNLKILRIYGLFPHPNVFAGFLVFTIFFIIYFLKNASKRINVLFSILLSLCVVALLFTFSRTAIIALCAGLILYFFLIKKKISLKKFILILVGFFILFLIFNIILVNLKWNTSFDIGNSLSERLDYLGLSYDLYLKNPFGVGIGNFTNVMSEIKPYAAEPWLIQPVHNIYLLLANEIGIQGALSFVLLFLCVIGFLFKQLKEKYNNFINILVSLFFVIFIIGFFDHYFLTLYQGQALFWVYLGLIGSLK
jgi:O-antigen ligase